MSTQFRLPVMEIILDRLPATLELVLLASLIASVLAFALFCPGGLAAGGQRNTVYRRVGGAGAGDSRLPMGADLHSSGHTLCAHDADIRPV